MSKIVVVNFPEAWVPAIKKLVGPESINSSRSELFRKAIARKLRQELHESKLNIPPKDPKEVELLENQRVNNIVKETMEKARNNHKLQNL